jgi:hypothetical protein
MAMPSSDRTVNALRPTRTLRMIVAPRCGAAGEVDAVVPVERGIDLALVEVALISRVLAAGWYV